MTCNQLQILKQINNIGYQIPDKCSGYSSKPRTGNIFSKIDLASGFWSVLLKEESKGKTAFMHKTKQYVYNRLPQGYCNSPNIFQTVMMDILQGLPLMVYSDILIVTSGSEQEHLKLLDEGLNQIITAGLKPSLKKMEVLKKEVDYLGFAFTGKYKVLSRTMRNKIEDLMRKIPATVRE